jgi:cytochrome b
MMAHNDNAEVKVWDPFVRGAHWILALAFAVAFLTEDDALDLHVWAGYVVAATVAARILWGFVGPRHARFTDFVYRPSAVLRYLADLATLRSRRHLGHSPAGGAMVVALLAFLAATTVTGMWVYAEEEGRGPLAGIVASDTLPQDRAPLTRGGEHDEDDDGRRGGESSLEELHEFFANVTLMLVLLHIGGVALASFAHRENLPRAMITGRKRREPGPPVSN